MKDRRLGRWQRLLLDALEHAEAIRVQTTIEASLGRRSTNIEITAARRAAHRLAQTGQAKLTHVAFPLTAGGSAALSVVLTRPDSRLIDNGDPDALRRAATAHAPSTPSRPDQTLRASVTAVEAAAAATTSADLSEISPAEAERWAVSLARSLKILNRFHHRLAHQARRRG